MFPTHKQNHQDMPANRNKQGQVQGQSESELSTSQYSKSQQARRQFQPPSRPPNQPLLSLCLAYITNSCPND